MKVKIKKLDEMAQLPKYAKESDAGMDLVAISKEITPDYIEYGTGLAMEIPEGYVGLIFPRSSISKHDLSLANAVGVIDSGYRGEVKCRFKVTGNNDFKRSAIYEVSDRVAQVIILPYPKIEFEWANDLSDTARGAGGFGSTN